MKEDEEDYTYTDYPTEPIGHGNPYYRCVSCGISVPEINGRLSRHGEGCEWVEKVREIESNGRALKALCALIMCSDPWPVPDEGNQKEIEDFANRLAQERGYNDWVEAAHDL